jgi:predicted transporter
MLNEIADLATLVTDAMGNNYWRDATGKVNTPEIAGAIVLASALVGVGWIAGAHFQKKWAARTSRIEFGAER